MFTESSRRLNTDRDRASHLTRRMIRLYVEIKYVVGVKTDLNPNNIYKEKLIIEFNSWYALLL